MVRNGYRGGMRTLCVAVLAAAVLLAACGQAPRREPDVAASLPPSGGTTSVLSAGEGTATAAADDEVRLLAVGDIAGCNTTNDDKVAKFVRSRTAQVALLGDTVYDNGTPEEYANCFDPHWGSILHRLRPAVGNHEYHTPGASGYFDYFGERAVRPGKGWYAYNLGDHWRAIVLNSQCAEVGGCTADSPQGRWLADALERAGSRNVLAYFHVPRYSSGLHGSSTTVKPLFRALYRARADIVLSGHDHSYERFAPQNARGERRSHGVQQFVVGTGGRGLYPFGTIRPHSRARNNKTYGVLRLILRPDGYSWRFVPVVGSYSDSGSRSLR